MTKSINQSNTCGSFSSPAGVGDIAVTKINFPFSFFETESIKLEFNLALSSPNLIKFF